MAQIVRQPELHRHFQHGIEQMVNAIRPTLGPVARTVAMSRILGNGLPELLDDGGLIARRIIELPHRSENSGAMFLRHILWRVRETVGDGTATTAVLFEAVFCEGSRYLAAGGNAMSLRRHLESGADCILAALDAQTQPLSGEMMLRQVAESICHDAELAAALGEIFAVIGPLGALDIRSGRGHDLHYDYLDGSYWFSSTFSKEMLRNPFMNRRVLQNAAVCITDLDIQDPRHLIPLMRHAMSAGMKGLVLVAKNISDQIKALILQNERPGQFDIIAVRVPGTKLDDQTANLDDLALLTGGQVLLQAVGDSLETIKPEQLGSTRRAWADTEHFGIVGGQGDAHKLRRHVESLTESYHRSEEAESRQSLQNRIGRLQGGTATLYAGGVTDDDRKARSALAERTSNALRAAMHTGIVAGGGVALRQCQAALRGFDALDADSRAAQRILHSALEAPMQALLMNAGYEPQSVMARLDTPSCGFDVLRGAVVDMTEAGVYDSAGVLKTAVQSAVSAAALALTTDVMIHQNRAPQVVNP